VYWPEGSYLFASERGGPMTASNERKLVVCGFKLANDRHDTCYGHDTRSRQHYLGHKNIAHTVRYTKLAPDRFKGFWRD
jgi:type 1 fimbriae regulatory protein FimB/type 1 fimbriae regulatory protein FimE